MNRGEVDHEVVIVGAGIAGLATALALHRKGIKSKIFERSETLPTKGTAIGIRANGWRALDQLGVADTLRHTAIHLHREREFWFDRNKEREILIVGECRCLMRNRLVQSLFEALPPGTVDFGCQVVSVALDTQTTYPVLQLGDGTWVVTKVLIGCDGGKSAIGNFLGLKPTKTFTKCAVRGLTKYPNGHPFPNESVRMWTGESLVGRKPMDDKLVYWYASVEPPAKDSNIWRDPQLIRQFALESLIGFPQDVTEMVKSSEQNSLSITRMRYRSPLEIQFGSFRKGTVTVAGDAMHVMGPFLAQGGSAGLEDAIVLARCLGKKLNYLNSNECRKKVVICEIGEALDDYVKERRMRLVRLSTQTYLTGLLESTPLLLMKFVYILLISVLFGQQLGHANFDCGLL